MFLTDRSLKFIPTITSARSILANAVKRHQPNVPELRRQLNVAKVAGHMRNDLPAVSGVTAEERAELICLIESIPAMDEEANK